MSERQKKTDEMLQIISKIRGLEARERATFGNDRAEAAGEIRSLKSRLNALKNELVMKRDAVQQKRATA